MKAERRHELQHNELADWVAVAVERVKPYSRAIVGVVVAAAVLLTTYVVLSNRAERKQTTAWTDYYLAIQGPLADVESDLEVVMREHEGVAAGRWAQVALADLKLGEGIKALFTDKAVAKKNLESAVEHYQAVIPEAEDALLVARARFGLGRALESQGELEKAREVYEQVVEASGTNAYVSLAEARLTDLKRDSTQDFYAWFEQQEPVAPPPAANSLPGTPGQKLPFDDSLLNTPGSVNLSGENILNVPGLDKGTGTGPLLPLPTGTDTDQGTVEPTKDAEVDPDKEADQKDAAKESDSSEKGDGKTETKDAAAESKEESESEDAKGDDAKKQEGNSSASPEGSATSDSDKSDQSSGKTP
jgi:tetratricopeptide (TPR) repeat protein